MSPIIHNLDASYALARKGIIGCICGFRFLTGAGLDEHINMFNRPTPEPRRNLYRGKPIAQQEGQNDNAR